MSNLNIHYGWKVVLGVVVGFVLLTQLLVWVWINPIIEQSLREIIRESTQHQYNISSISVDYNIFRQRLRIRDLHFEVDTTQLQLLQKYNLEGNNIIEAQIPALYVQSINIPGLIQKKILDVGGIRFEKPEIFYTQLTSAPVQDSTPPPRIDSVLSRDLYRLLAPAFKEISIGEFRIQGGTFHFHPAMESRISPLEITDISFRVKGFQMDSVLAENDNLPWKTDLFEWEWGVEDRPFILPDSSYQINLDRIGYSSKRQDFFLYNLRLNPYLTNDSTKKNIFRVQVPLLQLRGVLPRDLLYQKQAELQYILLNKPSVEIFAEGEEQSANNEKPKLPDLYPLIKPYLDWIRVDSIALREGNLGIYQSLEDSLPGFWFEDISVKAKDWYIDSLQYDRKDHIGYSQYLELALGKFYAWIPDSTYLIRGDGLSVKQNMEHISTDNLWVIPYKNSRENVIEAHIPRFEIENFELANLLYERKLRILSLTFSEPEVSFISSSNTQDSIGLAAQAALYPLLEPYMESLAIGTIDLQGGEFYLNEHIRKVSTALSAEEISLLVNDFRINKRHSKSDGPLFYAGAITLGLDINDYTYVLPDSSYAINIGEAGVSTRKKNLFARNITVNPLHQRMEDSSRIELYIPEVSLKGVDPYQIYFERKLLLDTISLSYPDLHVYQSLSSEDSSGSAPLSSLESLTLYPILADILEELQIKNSLIKGANLKLTTKNDDDTVTESFPFISVAIDSFALDSSNLITPQRLLYSNSIGLEIKDYEVTLPDSSYKIQIGKFGFNSAKQRFTIDSVKFKPLPKVSEAPVKVDALLRQITIDGFDPYEVLSDQKLNLSKIFFSAPEILLETKIQNKGDSTKARGESPDIHKLDLYPLISSVLKEIVVDSLQLRDGTLTWQDQEETLEPLEVKDLSIEVDAFRLDSSAKSSTGGLFYTRNIELNFDIQKYTFTFPDSSYRIELGDLGVSTADSIVFADSIRLVPLKASSINPVTVNLDLDRLQLAGIDFTKIYQEKGVDLRSVLFRNPRVRLLRNSELESSSSSRESGSPFRQKDYIRQDPYPAMSPYLRYLDIDSISVENGGFRLDGVGLHPITANDFSLTGLNFRIDSTSYDSLESGYIFAQEFIAVLRDYEIPLPDDSNYELLVDEIGVYSKEDSLYVNNLELVPKFSRYKFSRRIGHMLDRFSIKNKVLTASDLDVERFLKKQEISVRNVHLEEPYIEVFKDKRLPFPINKRPPMPVDIIHQVNLYMHIDSITLANGLVKYDEQQADQDTLAWFSLNDFSAVIGPVTNDPDLWAQNVESNMRVAGKMMNTGQLNANASFTLKDTLGLHRFSAQVGPMNARDFNPIMEPAARISIVSGNIKKVDFEFSADKTESRGKMRFIYDDLKINLMGNKQGKKPNKKKGFNVLGSALANTLVRNSNPRGRISILRVGRIGYEREINKGIIVYWVRSVVSGLLSSIGITSKDDKYKYFKPDPPRLSTSVVE